MRRAYDESMIFNKRSTHANIQYDSNNEYKGGSRPSERWSSQWGRQFDLKEDDIEDDEYKKNFSFAFGAERYIHLYYYLHNILYTYNCFINTVNA